MTTTGLHPASEYKPNFKPFYYAKVSQRFLSQEGSVLIHLIFSLCNFSLPMPAVIDI